MSRVRLERINYRGRFLYLEATGEYWPELLSSLPRPKVVWQLGPWPTFAEMASRSEYAADHQAILNWAKEHRINEAWIRDAAVQTIARNWPATAWHYVPPELPVAPLAMRFLPWIPAKTSWKAFRRDVTSQFNGLLKDYNRSVEGTWGVDRPRLETHAAWTVMWQRGKSAEQIRRYYNRSSNRSVTASNILMKVRVFAKEINLELREGKKGPARQT